jgi:hypothetical protein
MGLLKGLIGAARGEAHVENIPASNDGASILNPHTEEPGLVENYVLGFLDRYDTRPERSRDAGTDGYMHVSSLINMSCQRRSVLMQIHGTEHWENVSGGHRIMWAQGRATEDHIRKGVIASREGKGIYGSWKCKCGHAEHLGDMPNKKHVCAKCEHPLTVYHEPVLFDDDYMLTGSPDLTLILPQDYLLVNEIKSMTPDMFDDLTQPVPDHVAQVLMYREMLRRKGFKVHTHAVIIYGRKQFKWGGAFNKNKNNRVYKEYHVDATTPASQATVAACYATAETIKRHTAARAVPPRERCISSDSTLAKKCPVAHICFNLRE